MSTGERAILTVIGEPPEADSGSGGADATALATRSARRQQSLLLLPAPVVVRMIALSYLRRIRQAYRGFTETSDPEQLHELRVTVRRLRTLFRAYASELRRSVRRKDRRRLRDVARATAALRELDVRFAWVDEVTLDSEEFAAAERLRASAAEARADEVTLVSRQLDRAVAKIARRLRRRLRSYTLELEGRKAAATPLFAVALADTLTRQRHRFEQQLERAADSDDESRIHAARIAAKRLRYTIEPVAATETGTAATTELVDLQDRLGRFLDLGAAVVALDRELAAALRDGNAAAVSGLQGLLARARSERAELLDRVRADWIADAGQHRLTAVDRLVAEVLAAGE